MATSNRSTKIAKIHKVLKKSSYAPIPPDNRRSVLEQLVFAACLENARYEAAEQAFAALVHNFFDWNEVRVTTIRELAEEMACLPDPAGAAQRVKDVLQSVFEARYAFDLEDLRKENLGPATDRLRKVKGANEFAVAYVVQTALGGHAIPIDGAAMKVMEVLDLVKPQDVEAGVVPGIERAITKNHGSEFGSMLHQFAVDFSATPHKPELRKLLLEIDPQSAERLPKRRTRKSRTAQQADPPAGEQAPKQAEQAAGAGSEQESPQSTGPKTRKSAARSSKAAGEKKKKAPKAKAADKSAKTAKSAKAEKTARSGKTAAGKSGSSKGLSKKKPR